MKLTKQDVAGLLVAASFLIYLTLRALLIPITTDEANTCMAHVQRGWLDILFYIRDAYPNNHPLNTLIIKGFSTLFGMSLLTARLPNLLGGVLFVVASLGIAQRLSPSVWVRSVAVVVLLGNPFLAEFLALARGYGLGCGLMVGAIWQGWKYLDNGRPASLRWSVLLAGLSVLANFTLLYFFLPFCATLLMILREKSGSFRQFLEKSSPVLLAAFVTFALIFHPLQQMSAGDELRFWGMGGFWKETLQPLLICSTQTHPDSPQSWVLSFIAWSVGIVAILGWYSALHGLAKGRITFDDPKTWVCGLFFGAFATNVLLTFFFSVPFLNTRTALFYYPLFALQFAVLAAWFWGKSKRLARPIFGAICLLFAWNFSRCANLKSSFEWLSDAHTLEALNHLKDVYQTEHRTAPITLEVNAQMQNSYLFHIEHDRFGFAKFVSITPWHPAQAPKGETEFYVTENGGEADVLKDRFVVALVLDKHSGWNLLQKK